MVSLIEWRVIRRLLGAVFAGLASLAAAAHAQSVANARELAPLEATMRDDAALLDVFFVNPAEGWAVGDRGVVWHTRDAGANWEQQESHVNSPLAGVFFLDAKRGWAVGGAGKPYTSATAGVMLQTADGGATWSQARGTELLPALCGVRFFNSQQAIAFGANSHMFASGACLTHDGGRSWQPVPCDGAGQWLAGDFVEGGVGALAGANGRFATLVSGEVKQSPLASGSLRSLRAMRLVAPQGGWVVGDGGFVATTSDLGRSWQMPAGELPNRAGEQFDFHAVATGGRHVWLAGSPGSRVFHSSDGGESWQAFDTGQTAAIRALTFVDAQRGWAAGELGTILATRDGGRTWRLQKSGGTRAALLGVFARPGDVPLELVTKQGAAEGYLTAINILFRPTASPASARLGSPQAAGGATSDAGESSRTREAMLLAGATAVESAWQFPLPPDDLALDPKAILDALDRANDGQAAERLLSTLVRQIRMWRPEVIVTQGRGADDSDSLAAFVEQLVMQAVEVAGDRNLFVELAEGAGLEAWQVKRVYGVLPGSARGHDTVGGGQFAPQLGATLADWSAPARRLLTAAHSHPPDTYGLNLLMSRVDGGAQGAASSPANAMFQGIALAPGGDARRRAAALPAGDMDQLRRLAARRRNLEALLERKAGDAVWAGQVVQLTDGLPAASGGELVFQLADGYRQSGRLDLAADTYYLVARRYPEHPLAEQALRWLVQYYASGEAATRANSTLPQSATRLSSPQAIRNPKSEIATDAGAVQQAIATMPLRGETPPTVGIARDERLRRAVELGKYLESARPTLFAEPAVRFPLVAAERQLGFANPAKRYFLTLRPLPANDPWRRCAETESWLAEPRDMPPRKALGRCRRTGERPHLDGQLDEPFWEAAEVLRLAVSDTTRGGAPATRSVAANDPASSIEHPASSIRLAYDAEFLFIAVRCPKAAGGDYAADDRPRPHDGDLAAHDRVALRFDLDRDYVTALELVVDHRGWTQDASLGDASWNPTWFVAAAADDATWTVEAAVPLAELTERRPEAKHVWAVGVRRTIPRMGYETWAGDAADKHSPDQFGLLLFE